MLALVLGLDEGQQPLDLAGQVAVRPEDLGGVPQAHLGAVDQAMGLVQRDSIDRLRHARRYSGFFGSICTNPAWTGFTMGAGTLRGPDPREMAKSDCVVIWGTNAVSTQVNVMTHAVKARKDRGAKIVVVDIYDNPTMKQADMKLILKPGSDAALACAAMHIAFRDGYADRDYMARYADDPSGLEEHLKDRTPQWAAAITGLSVEEIEAFARLVGTTKKSYFRLGYGFSRSRNGAVSMHAALSLPTVLGSWQHEGGGGFRGIAGKWYAGVLERVSTEPLKDAVEGVLNREDHPQCDRTDHHLCRGEPEYAARICDAGGASSIEGGDRERAQ